MDEHRLIRRLLIWADPAGVLKVRITHPLCWGTLKLHTEKQTCACLQMRNDLFLNMYTSGPPAPFSEILDPPVY